MRLFGRALALAFLVSCFAPGGASAAPFLLDDLNQQLNGDDCTVVLAGIGTAECGWFAISPGAVATAFNGEFRAPGDMLLFSFQLAAGTHLEVATSSFGEGHFDPTLALYRADGSIRSVLDPQGSGQMIAANQFDIDFANLEYDDRIDIVAEETDTYLLAMVFGFAYESLLDPFECAAGCDFGERGREFALSVTATPEDGAPAPVPEPATLTLMAGGAIAGLWQRRRTKNRIRAKSVST